MANIRENGGEIYITDNAFDRDVELMWALPESLRDFILYEAAGPIDVADLRNYYIWYGLSWQEIERMVRRFCREDHRRAFGGVHPSLDPPRRVW
jgi:hypothetical protein